MKPYLILLLSLLAFAGHGQSVVLSNLNILMPAVGKPLDSMMSLGVQCQLTAPIEGAAIDMQCQRAIDITDHGVGILSWHAAG